MNDLVKIILCLSVFTSANAISCSFAELGTSRDLASGQNFDFYPQLSAGIIINKRNVEKTDGGFESAPLAPPMVWVSKYGSVTFGFGNGVPVTGVNEAGLRVYRFLFLEAKYPTPNTKPSLEENLYVQYLLDTAKSVDEVIQKTNAIQIYTPRFPTHFAVCDRDAKCVVIEALNGEMKIFSGTDVKVDAVTNTDYARSLELYRQCPTADCYFVGDESEWRFVKAATQIKEFSGSDFMNGTFNILNSVAQVGPRVATLWTLLMHLNQTENLFYVKNSKSSKIVFSVDLGKLDFSCKSPNRVALLSPGDDSDVRLVDYDSDFQQKLAAIMNRYLGVSSADMQKWIEYPDKKTRCLE